MAQEATVKKRNLFIFGCAGSSSLHAGFLELRRVGSLFTVVRGLLTVALRCRAQAPGARASVAAARGLRSCASWPPERAGFSSRDTWAL